MNENHEREEKLEEGRLRSVVESLLFASPEPLSDRRLAELTGESASSVRRVLRELASEYAEAGRGIRLEEVAGGFQLRTAPENAAWVRALFRERPRRLGRAALETLAIVAYRQPITRAEIEEIRGVDVEGVLAGLVERGLVRICGRKETVGRPLLYGTTDAFLEQFGLRSLADLPPLRSGETHGAEQGHEPSQEEGGNSPPEAPA
ncbi:MAG: segregation and condensation protein B [Candidatus Binatia bacterium]|nr:MAG: segregation and condensation protein B [Candidatus Binatia bacterium]